VDIWRFDSLSNGNAVKTKNLFSFSFHFNLKNKLNIGNSDQISSLEVCNIFGGTEISFSGILSNIKTSSNPRDFFHPGILMFLLNSLRCV